MVGFGPTYLPFVSVSTSTPQSAKARSTYLADLETVSLSPYSSLTRRCTSLAEAEACKRNSLPVTSATTLQNGYAAIVIPQWKGSRSERRTCPTLGWRHHEDFQCDWEPEPTSSKEALLSFHGYLALPGSQLRADLQAFVSGYPRSPPQILAHQDVSGTASPPFRSSPSFLPVFDTPTVF